MRASDLCDIVYYVDVVVDGLVARIDIYTCRLLRHGLLLLCCLLNTFILSWVGARRSTDKVHPLKISFVVNLEGIWRCYVAFRWICLATRASRRFILLIGSRSGVLCNIVILNWQWRCTVWEKPLLILVGGFLRVLVLAGEWMKRSPLWRSDYRFTVGVRSR